MADINTFLQKILSAIYGEEVRGSIHDALSAMNTESSHAMQYASTAKDSAQASAAAARESETNTAQKAIEARTSAENAKTSETNAVQRASEAAASSSQAKASETACADSEAIATQKSRDAADSSTAAALSAAEAKAAEERSKTLKAETETFAAQTASDKVDAETAKAAAQEARIAAAGSQTEAKASANTALLAKTAAEFAKEDAETAKLAAQAAKDASEVAKSDAESARDAAETSRESAAESAALAMQYSGKPPKPQNGTWWIWDAAEQAYVDSGIRCELVGPAGNGIADIQLTNGDHTPGTTDIYTVTMTDGTSRRISVYNGRNGTGTGDVLGIFFDLVIPAAGWANGEITIADSRLLALANYSYFIKADESSRDAFLECGIQPRDITTDGMITFENDINPTEDLTVNVVRLELSANGA